MSLTVVDITVGNGNAIDAGSEITVHYQGWLQDGTEFDSSVARKQPLTIVLGQGQVIRGWDMGLEGMRVGGKRRLTIAPELAYGNREVGGVIPKNATLIFEVELLQAS